VVVGRDSGFSVADRRAAEMWTSRLWLLVGQTGTRGRSLRHPSSVSSESMGLADPLTGRSMEMGMLCRRWGEDNKAMKRAKKDGSRARMGEEGKMV